MYDKSEITKVDAERLLAEYETVLEQISQDIKDWDDQRCTRADIHLIPLLLMALRAISEEKEIMEYNGSNSNNNSYLYQICGGMSGLDYYAIQNKSPRNVIAYLCTFSRNWSDLFIRICVKYLSQKPEDQYKVASFFYYLSNPNQIRLNEQLGSLVFPDDYFVIENSEEEENSQLEDEGTTPQDEISPLISTNTNVSASLFWQFVDFIEDNQKIIIAAVLVTFAIAGLIAFTIGTGGLGLLGASAATAITYIGITGGAAIATTAVGAGVATASIAGLVGLGIFSCADDREDTNCENLKIENI